MATWWDEIKEHWHDVVRFCEKGVPQKSFVAKTFVTSILMIVIMSINWYSKTYTFDNSAGGGGGVPSFDIKTTISGGLTQFCVSTEIQGTSEGSNCVSVLDESPGAAGQEGESIKGGEAFIAALVFYIASLVSIITESVRGIAHNQRLKGVVGSNAIGVVVGMICVGVATTNNHYDVIAAPYVLNVLVLLAYVGGYFYCVKVFEMSTSMWTYTNKLGDQQQLNRPSSATPSHNQGANGGYGAVVDAEAEQNA